ncbi:Fe-S cluster assembly protein SufD [Aestuariivirga sp.]|uniref:Fe-S cluster assembly protein SufD n=1 Tax=Aestuariivirga sp. TaxID=2650926 RepID=UPI0039E6E8F8
MALTRTPAETALGMALPHRRMEDWRWTDLRALVDRPYPPHVEVKAKAADVERLLKSSPFSRVAATRMVFVNGLYDAARSQLGNGRVVTAVLREDPILELNALAAMDGARLTLSGETDTPVELLFISTDAEARTTAIRNVIEVAPGSTTTLIETHLGEGSYLANPITELRIGAGARVDRVKVELESKDALHLAHFQVTLEKDARFNDFTLTSGARVNRQNGNCLFIGQNAQAHMGGAYLLSGRQHADTRLVVDHAVPHCTSRELFKCVMDDYARGIFQGKVVVRKDAQKTDGKQSSHALLLSETAEFDAKPELEIFADDVVCGHGATSGDLNHDHLFYLKSRGIPEGAARKLLVAAFVSEAFDTVQHDGLREALVALVEARFG